MQAFSTVDQLCLTGYYHNSSSLHICLAFHSTYVIVLGHGKICLYLQIMSDPISQNMPAKSSKTGPGDWPIMQVHCFRQLAANKPPLRRLATVLAMSPAHVPNPALMPTSLATGCTLAYENSRLSSLRRTAVFAVKLQLIPGENLLVMTFFAKSLRCT